MSVSRSAPHIFAALCGLSFAWVIFNTTFVVTGLQFIAPVIVVIVAHIAWLLGAKGFMPGWSQTVLLRAATTSLIIIVAVVATLILAPNPSHANGLGTVVGSLGTVVFCLVIVAVVMGVAVLIIYIPIKLIVIIVKALRKSDDDQLHDFGTMAVVAVVLAIGSFEGVPWAYSFAPGGEVSASYDLDVEPSHVWKTLNTATAIDFPIPGFLQALPHPVAVSVDEGVDLNARRVVDFAGREGAGALSLIVVERTQTRAVFQVVSDTTPLSQWVGLNTLTYTVVPHAGGSRLTVDLIYDRQLAPAWFFGPFTQLGTWMAVDVLARDSAARAG